MGIIRENVMVIYLNKYLITFIDDGGRFPKVEFFLWNLMEQVDSLIEQTTKAWNSKKYDGLIEQKSFTICTLFFYKSHIFIRYISQNIFLSAAENIFFRKNAKYSWKFTNF